MKNIFCEILSQPKDKHLYTPIFKDTEDYVYTYFQNGIVKTDMNGSSLMSYNDVSTGYIWESQILPKSIEIDKNRKGDFVDFVNEISLPVSFRKRISVGGVSF